ncbi:hypothetical protein NDU88_002290 [Pleurodeles waltl]|uniref:Uncharacterized protein n=1 Tax=Pleurodeles waltl TaxID=8319 RepID=A0AAV7LDT2_PLEWA|nr:hypothetical protein NDU88_002290 [Pleurodeles waltl]
MARKEMAAAEKPNKQHRNACRGGKKWDKKDTEETLAAGVPEPIKWVGYDRQERRGGTGGTKGTAGQWESGKGGPETQAEAQSEGCPFAERVEEEIASTSAIAHPTQV